MGMYDIINSEQVKCFPWITYQYDKNSDIRFWNHGGSLKNFNNTDAVPYRSLCYNYHKDFNILDLHPTALPFDNGIVLHVIRNGKVKESITIVNNTSLIPKELQEHISDYLSTAHTIGYTGYPELNVHSYKEGWLAPSVQNKVDSHLTIIRKVHKILPITKIIVEVASFDIQKIKNSTISGTKYQQGEQLDFWNVREYVLFRDSHICQCCKGKSKDKILNVHHIESRKTGGDAPNNLITLCETCHTGYHKGIIKLPKTIHRGMSFKDATFMGIMRWAFYNKLKEIYPNVSLTYGYITKNTRIRNSLPKEHYIDARCISDNPKAISNGMIYYQKKVRCHNRQIHKNTILKGGIRKRNQASYDVMGFRLFDKVKWKGQNCFIFGRRSTGRMDLRLLNGTKINASVGYKNLKIIEMRKNYLIEQRKVG